MPLLLCHEFPQLAIYNPDTKVIVQFRGGRLDIEEDDPNYAVVMAEALRNPAIVVYTSATTCDRCGEVFAGGAAKAQLGKHRKDAHFDVWLAEKEQSEFQVRQVEVKAREGVACEVCRPFQTFPTRDELAAHVRTFHIELTPDEERVASSIAEDRGEGGVPAAAPA